MLMYIGFLSNFIKNLEGLCLTLSTLHFFLIREFRYKNIKCHLKATVTSLSVELLVNETAILCNAQSLFVLKLSLFLNFKSKNAVNPERYL